MSYPVIRVWQLLRQFVTRCLENKMVKLCPFDVKFTSVVKFWHVVFRSVAVFILQ